MNVVSEVGSLQSESLNLFLQYAWLGNAELNRFDRQVVFTAKSL